MKHQELQALFHSLNDYEINCLEQSRKVFEQTMQVKFASVQAYINHLAGKVIEKKLNGEFVPRHIEEARAGHYLP